MTTNMDEEWIEVDWLGELIYTKSILRLEEAFELASIIRKAIDDRLPKLKEVGSISSAIDEQEYTMVTSKMLGWNAAVIKIRKALGLIEDKKEKK